MEAEVPKVYAWSDIAGDFRQGLIVGNGASILIHADFAYSSLLQAARDRSIITPKVDQLFRSFKTSDFEYVLRGVWTANQVNRALGVRDYFTKRVYNGTRRSLIRVVQAIHPQQAAVREQLRRGAQFLAHHSIVVSLNYDLLLYWAMLLGNEQQHETKFKDCFVDDGRFRYEWQGLVEPIPPYKKSVLVFYAHGSLALATGIDGEEIKVARSEGGPDLLPTITSRWISGELRPLFVSEGSSAQKRASILRSRYLGRVLESVLPNLGKNVTVFGSSIQENDRHIFSAILGGGTQRLAVSLHGPQIAEVEATTRRLLVRLDEAAKEAHRATNDIEVVFFDAGSAGAWVN